MQKEFIPYELALELKELGYNQSDYLNWYNLKGKLQWDSEYSESEFSKKCCSAPLYQQVFRWFRERYNLNGILNHYPNTKLWDFSVHDLRWTGKEFIGYVKKEDRSVRYSTYEEAEIACVKKLIEIVKTK